MDCCDRLKKVWGPSLNVQESEINLDSGDDDVQGLLILLQVLSSNVKRLAIRCLTAENSLAAAKKEHVNLEAEVGKLINDLLSEKAKQCSQCPTLKSQLEFHKKALAEKSEPCSGCLKYKKRFRQNEERLKSALKSLTEVNAAFSVQDQCNTAFNQVSQMLLLNVSEDEDSSDGKRVCPQKLVTDTPKRKSPCFDKELDTGNRKRKSPCVDPESNVSHPLLKDVKKEEKSYEGLRIVNKLSSSKKFTKNKTEIKTETQCLDDKYKIVVPETLPDEHISPVTVQQNIIIPETLYPQDDFAASLPEADCMTPQKQVIDRDEDLSPVLSASKKPIKSNNPNIKNFKNEVDKMEIADQECISPSTVHPNEKSPSVLAMDPQPNIDTHIQSKGLKVLDDFFDEMDKSSLKKNKIVSKDCPRSSKAEKIKAGDNFISTNKKTALGEKNIWALKNPSLDEEKVYPRKMKQTTLAVISVPKNQDISNNDSFNGGVLCELPNDENFDSDDSDCLILPSPKNKPDLPSVALSGVNSTKLKAESNFIERRTGTVASLEETYFAPQVTSTCLSLSRRNKAENEEKADHKTAKDKTKKQDLSSSFDRVPSKETSSPKYKYKGDPVRKKDERQQLPGWDCENCAKYYAMANRDGEDAQKLINMCSRHRSKYKDFNCTVKGFWDPCIPDTQD